MDLVPKDPKLGEFVFSILPPDISGFSLYPPDGDLHNYEVRYKKPQRTLLSEIGPQGWKEIVGTELHINEKVTGTIDKKKKIFTFEGLRGEKLLKFLGISKLIRMKLKKIQLVERRDGSYDFIVKVSSGFSITDKWTKEKFMDTFRHLSWDK